MVQQYLALLVFASYFLANFTFSYLVWLSILATPKSKRLEDRNALKGKVGLHLALAAGSLLTVWYHVINYIQGSFADYRAPFTDSYFQANRLHIISSWLADSSLFLNGWCLVTGGWSNWWWTEQLCLYTAGAWAVFLYIEGRKHKISNLWAYMIFGQLVGVSVASNLFYAALVLSTQDTKDEDESSVSYSLYTPILLSLTSIALTPYSSGSIFIIHLALMHVLPVLPLIEDHRPFGDKLPTIPTPIFYSIIAFAAMLMRLSSSRVPFHHDLNRGNPPEYLSWRGIAYLHWETLNSNSAQGFIGWDVIWSTFSFLVWEITKPGDRKWVVGLPSVLIVLWGIGFASPAVWALYS